MAGKQGRKARDEDGDRSREAEPESAPNGGGRVSPLGSSSGLVADGTGDSTDSEVHEIPGIGPSEQEIARDLGIQRDDPRLREDEPRESAEAADEGERDGTCD